MDKNRKLHKRNEQNIIFLSIYLKNINFQVNMGYMVSIVIYICLFDCNN